MLDVEKQRTFVRLAASASPGASARSLAKAAGFTPDYGPRLLRRHAAAIERRRRNLENLGKRRPKYKPGMGEVLRLLEEGGDAHLVHPPYALRWWRQKRADLDDLELRWRDPSQLEAHKASRILDKARQDLDAATARVAEVFRVHGEAIPSDLLARRTDPRGRAERTPAQQATVGYNDAADHAPARTSAKADHLAGLRPPDRCPTCCLMPWAEPVYGIISGRGIGIVSTKIRCGCDGGEATIYATERSRQLAFGHHARVLASTGVGSRDASPFAARSYDWDPFDC